MARFMLKTSEDDAGVEYEVPRRLTIGEEEDVYRTYGADAAHLGVVWIAVRRRFPNTTPKDISNCFVEPLPETEEDKLPPTFAAGNSPSEENGKPTEALDTGNLGSESSTA